MPPVGDKWKYQQYFSKTLEEKKCFNCSEISETDRGSLWKVLAVMSASYIEIESLCDFMGLSYAAVDLCYCEKTVWEITKHSKFGGFVNQDP